MQQRGDCLIFATAVLDHERADAEQMPDVGDAAALADLGSVCRGGELKRLLESLAELDPPGRAVEILVHNDHPNGARRGPTTDCGSSRNQLAQSVPPRRVIGEHLDHVRRYARATPGELTARSTQDLLRRPPTPGRIVAMPGHLFITRGDLKRLACDAILVPSGIWDGSDGHITGNWTSLGLPMADGRVTPAPSEESRAVKVRDGSPAIWLGHTGAAGKPPGWYAEAITAFVRAAGKPSTPLAKHRPLGDDRPLLGVPVVGIGEGGAEDVKGDVVRETVETILKTLGEAKVLADVVLVAWTREAYAAAQQARALVHGDSWLAMEWRKSASTLAEHARNGQLVLFMGAGTGIGAGLPTWRGLLGGLRDRAGVTDAEDKKELDALDPRDAGLVLDRRLKDRGESLVTAIIDQVKTRQVSLVHQLLASWPVREAVTTNYDTCFERAWTDADRKHVVLPKASAQGAKAWLLKLHGSIDDRNRIVLSREDYLRLEGEGVALAGVVQAMLLTRHMLFVGYSLSDDNFHRLVHQAKAAIGTIEQRPEALLGTAITPERPGLSADIWDNDIQFLSTADEPEGAARQLAVVLDYVGQQAAAPAAHMLDDTYSGVFSAAELTLRDQLRELSRAAEQPGVRPSVSRAATEMIDTLEGI